MDEQAYRLATASGTVARVEPLQTKILNRYTVIGKNRTTLDIFRSIFQSLEGRRYLDVGCGMGMTMHDARAIGFEFADGLEIDPAFYRRSEVIQKGFSDPKVRSFLSDFLHHEFDCKYDVITFFDVFEHILDHRAALDKARSLLTDDGLIFVYQGNFRSSEIVRTEPHYRVPGLSLLPRPRQVEIVMSMRKIASKGDFVVNVWPRLELFMQADSLDCYLNISGRNIRGGRPHNNPADTLRHLRGMTREERVWSFPGSASLKQEDKNDLVAGIARATDELDGLLRSKRDHEAYRSFAIGSWEMILVNKEKKLGIGGFEKISD